VVDRFVADYLGGRTPNPCVLCNQHVKFSTLLERVRPLGARWVATGHHARLDPLAPQGPRLRRGADPEKDQSYALWSVPRDTLRHTLLPVGDLTKDQVRAHAGEAGLPVAAKLESQDICFVPDGDYGRFVAEHVDGRAPALEPGPIVDGEGHRLGTHDGVARYTVGQRRGLGIAHPEPLYVVAIDAGTNTLTVGPRADLARRTFVVDEVNWVSVDGLPTERSAGIQIRYRHRGVAGLLRPGPEGRVEVVLAEPQDAVTPGQSAVFYDGDVVLGGGVIAADVVTSGCRSPEPGATPARGR
jgi:tRNA-specific 2-thiouridylase